MANDVNDWERITHTKAWWRTFNAALSGLVINCYSDGDLQRKMLNRAAHLASVAHPGE